MKRITKIIAIILTVLSINCTSVFAIEPSISRYEIKQKLLEVGVNENKVDSLVTKIQDGEKLDCMKEKYNNIKPTVKSWTDTGGYEKYVYPDGSVKTLSVTPAIVTGSIIDGTRTSGSNWYEWKNARVIASWGVVTASFYANIFGATGQGKINKVWGKGATVVGGTFSGLDLKTVRAETTNSTPAQARLYFIGKCTGDFGQSTFYLRLYVPYNSAPYAKFSMPN